MLFRFIFCKYEGTVTESNVAPRLDTTGTIMDIHDGNTFLHSDGLYYYFGASYGLCEEPNSTNGCADFGFGNCGFRLDHNVSLFTSPDLVTWTNEGHIFEMANSGLQPGVLFCPKVLYNNQTSIWVLWFNWISEKAGWSTSYYAVATSQVAQGPYVIVTSNVTTLAFNDTGDFSLFKDENDTAYILYTSHITGYDVTHQMSVEQLSADYLSSMGNAYNSGFFGSANVEAPAMFKRNNTYYAVFGSTCCYCQQGAPVVVHIAQSPLGPYITANSTLGSSIPSQQTNVLEYLSSNGPQYLWQGDRWQSAPDGLKGHDFSYWGPMTFDSEGNVQPFTFLDTFTINVAVPDL